MSNKKNTLLVLCFALVCFAGIVLMALGGYDKDDAFLRWSLAMVTTEGWVFSYNQRHERCIEAKRKVRCSILVQAISGTLMCIVSLISPAPRGSLKFWLSLTGAVIWTVFSVLMSCALYDAD